MNVIGRLERVALREVWQHEAYDFSSWLQSHIDVLDDVVGLGLTNAQPEQSAGTFRVDLVSEDMNGNKVIIENQLEKSNHDHLGKLLTYAVAMDARAAIWIVSDPRPEHVAAIAWLNDSSSGTFYLIKVEAVKIGASPPAPLFTLIVGPSPDSQDIARSNQDFAERHTLRQRWWRGIVNHPMAGPHSHLKAGTHTYLGISTGLRGVAYNYHVVRDTCDAEVYIDRGPDKEDENKRIFDGLHAQKERIESAFGGVLDWQEIPGKRGYRVRATIDGGYSADEADWEEIHDQLVDTMARLMAAMQPVIDQITPGFR